MRKEKTPSIVSIAILTFLTLLLWVTLGVVSLLRQNPEVNVKKETLQPLSPELGVNVLTGLPLRVYFQEDEIGETIFEEIPLEEGDETTATTSGSVESDTTQ